MEYLLDSLDHLSVEAEEIAVDTATHAVGAETAAAGLCVATWYLLEWFVF